MKIVYIKYINGFVYECSCALTTPASYIQAVDGATTIFILLPLFCYVVFLSMSCVFLLYSVQHTREVCQNSIDK